MNEDAFRSFSSWHGRYNCWCYVNKSSSDRESEFMSRTHNLFPMLVLDCEEYETILQANCSA